MHQHVVLADYLDLPLPSRLFVSSGDFRWTWAGDPKGYEQNLYVPNYGTIPGMSWRIPHQPSFRVGLGFYDVSNPGQRANPASYSLIFVPSGNVIRQKLLSSVVHPTQKVLVHDAYAWHFGPPQWHMHPDARIPALMVDASASVRAFAESNTGAHPNTGSALQVQYNPPFSWEPGYPGGLYRGGPLWTRATVGGRDFGGPEVFP
jgi:hypothetical protein